MTRWPILVAALALSGCAPQRDCGADIYYTGQADSVSVRGDFTSWEPMELDSYCGCLWHRRFYPDPGDYLYLLDKDDELIFDRHAPLRGWRDGEEYSMLRVPDCTAPSWRVEEAVAGEDSLQVKLQFLSGSSGRGLDRSSISARTRTGAILDVSAQQEPGQILLTARDLEPGKHTVTVTAADAAGAAVEPLWLPLWVEAEPFAWQDALVYQVLVDRFADADGTLTEVGTDPGSPGLRWGGDLQGLLRVLRSGYFEGLGANTLWLSPLNKNAEGRWPGNGGHEYESYHGYWPTEPRALEPALGTADDLDAVVSEAHKRGLRVLLDVVPNHVHTDHPYWVDHQDDGWFHDSGCVCGTAECPWYGNIQTCWFAPYLADLDWKNPEVAAAVTADIAWWVERFDLDGLRIDAVPMMPRSAVRELVYELSQRFEQGPTRLYLVGETFTGDDDWNAIARNLGPFGLDGQFDFPLMWSLRQVLGQGQGSTAELADVITTSAAAWDGSGAVMASFVGNHDVSRFLSDAVGDAGDPWENPPPAPALNAPYQRLVLAQTVAYTVPGAPVLYYGDELGMPGSGDPDNRRPMRFGDELSERERWTLDRVSRLGQARGCSTALRRGELKLVHAEGDVLAYLRDAGDGAAALVVVNRAEELRHVALRYPPGALSVDVVVDALDGSSASVSNRTLSLDLPPLQARVFLPTGSCPALSL